MGEVGGGGKRFARAMMRWLLERLCRREWNESLPPEMRAMTLRKGDIVVG